MERPKSAVEIFGSVRFAEENDMFHVPKYLADVFRAFARCHDNRQRRMHRSDFVSEIVTASIRQSDIDDNRCEFLLIPRPACNAPLAVPAVSTLSPASSRKSTASI